MQRRHAAALTRTTHSKRGAAPGPGGGAGAAHSATGWCVRRRRPRPRHDASSPGCLQNQQIWPSWIGIFLGGGGSRAAMAAAAAALAAPCCRRWGARATLPRRGRCARRYRLPLMSLKTLALLACRCVCVCVCLVSERATQARRHRGEWCMLSCMRVRALPALYARRRTRRVARIWRNVRPPIPRARAHARHTDLSFTAYLEIEAPAPGLGASASGVARWPKCAAAHTQEQ